VRGVGRDLILPRGWEWGEYERRRGRSLKEENLCRNDGGLVPKNRKGPLMARTLEEAARRKRSRSCEEA